MAERNVLAAIVTSKEAEIRALQAEPVLPARAGVPRDVEQRLRRAPGDPLRLIGEIKRKSPSAGPLSCVLSVADRAIAYARGGAAMISVLCDGPFFDGSWAHVTDARAALDAANLTTPILAKEFVLDARQIDEAAARGASAVLLIARIVDPASLAALHAHAIGRGLTPLVEVVNEAEIAAALSANAHVIGVNARDLDTLVMDTDRAARLLAAIPEDRVKVHLSGLKRPDDVTRIARTATVDAALIGEALMRADDPGPLLRDLTAAAKS